LIAVSEGVVAVGESDDEAIIAKYDQNGNLLWQKSFGGADHDSFSSVTEVPDGFIAVGYSSSGSFGNGDLLGINGKGGVCDGMVAKFSTTGNLIWAKNFGGAGTEYLNSVTGVPGGFIFTGRTSSDSFGNGDWVGVEAKGNYFDEIVVKFDDAGNVEWANNTASYYPDTLPGWTYNLLFLPLIASFAIIFIMRRKGRKVLSETQVKENERRK
jgi:hypothetical protein